MSDMNYDRVLETDGRDLSAMARAGQLKKAHFREAELGVLVELLKRQRPGLVVGPNGAGKTALIHGVAGALAALNVPLIEISTTGLLAGTKYIGEWQTKVTAAARSAIAKKGVLYFTDLWNLPHAGRTSNSNNNMLDALRPFIEAGQLVLLGEATSEVLRAMQKSPRFVELFQQVAVAPLGAKEVDGILEREAKERGLDLDAAARQSLVKLTSRFLAARTQPAPALGLLTQVEHYLSEKAAVGEHELPRPAFIEKVFSIYSGLPLFIVSSAATMSAAEIRAFFQERIVGQERAIEAVVEAIALFKAGLNDPARPIGTFLFVGPTGVGKTELARALACFLFGSPHRLLRFDLSEFKDYHSFEMLLGSNRDPERPAALADPVRAQPFQVVLFDELEKAHANIYDLLLPLLDEGRLTPPGLPAVDFRSTILIATSNSGAEEAEKELGFGSGEVKSREAKVRSALEHTFRPEFLNRFQHVVVFHPLTRDQVRKVARQELARILAREGITSRNLVVEVDDEALDLVIARGFEPRYGARALKREIQAQLVLPLAMTLMERPIEAGQLLRVSARDGRVRVAAVDTAMSRAARREKEPVKLPRGRKWTRDDLLEEAEALLERAVDIDEEIDRDFLTAEIQRLTALKADPAFWKYPEQAATALRDLERAAADLDRVAELGDEGDALYAAARKAGARAPLTEIAQRAARLDERLVLAERELILLGRKGIPDALLEIRPVGETGRAARDFVFRLYERWAKDQRFTLDRILEPLADDESVICTFSGPYALGYLRGETGLHRVAEGAKNGIARVRVAPWSDARLPARFLGHQALKREGAYAGKVRSRVECEGGLVLQNGRTLAENRDLAGELVAAWGQLPAPTDEVVRRYDPGAPLVRDLLTDLSSGHPDALSPQRFHALLCDRLKLLAKK